MGGLFCRTPVLALAAQLGLLILLVTLDQRASVGRPLPLPHTDRRSSLEFVASMAELQERSRAFDLAIENIYTRTRRVLAVTQASITTVRDRRLRSASRNDRLLTRINRNADAPM